MLSTMICTTMSHPGRERNNTRCCRLAELRVEEQPFNSTGTYVCPILIGIRGVLSADWNVLESRWWSNEGDRNQLSDIHICMYAHRIDYLLAINNEYATFLQKIRLSFADEENYWSPLKISSICCKTIALVIVIKLI